MDGLMDGENQRRSNDLVIKLLQSFNAKQENGELDLRKSWRLPACN